MSGERETAEVARLKEENKELRVSNLSMESSIEGIALERDRLNGEVTRLEGQSTRLEKLAKDVTELEARVKVPLCLCPFCKKGTWEETPTAGRLACLECGATAISGYKRSVRHV